MQLGDRLNQTFPKLSGSLKTITGTGSPSCSKIIGISSMVAPQLKSSRGSTITTMKSVTFNHSHLSSVQADIHSPADTTSSGPDTSVKLREKHPSLSSGKAAGRHTPRFPQRRPPTISPPGIYSNSRSYAQNFHPVSLEAAPSFLRSGASTRRGIGIGGGLPLPSRSEHQDFNAGPVSRTIEAYRPVGPTSGASSIFRGRVLDGRHFEDETPRTGRFRCPEDYQRRREKRQRERIERGVLIGIDISISVDESHRFPFSEIEALGEILELRRQMFYNTPHPSCAFYVIAEEAYCCLRGFTRYLDDLP